MARSCHQKPCQLARTYNYPLLTSFSVPAFDIMPTAKHVRFASTNTLYSLTSPPSTIPWKDSYTKSRRSSFTASSSGSSSSQGTPLQPEVQPLPHTRSRVSSSTSSSSQGTPHKNPHSLPTAPAVPHINNQAFQLHYLLAYSPYMNSSVKYDLSLHPSILADYYPAASLLEPATNPPVPSLTIKGPTLHWPVFVTPSPFLATKYVTVVDVLNCLYHELRTNVLKHEYETVPHADRRNVDAAFFSRCRQISDPEARKDEHRKGVKRVDFLMGRNRFLGLSGTRKHPNIWELNVSTWAGD